MYWGQLVCIVGEDVYVNSLTGNTYHDLPEMAGPLSSGDTDETFNSNNSTGEKQG